MNFVSSDFDIQEYCLPTQHRYAHETPFASLELVALAVIACSTNTFTALYRIAHRQGLILDNTKRTQLLKKKPNSKIFQFCHLLLFWISLRALSGQAFSRSR